jgi:hypothetical protein
MRMLAPFSCATAGQTAAAYCVCYCRADHRSSLRVPERFRAPETEGIDSAQVFGGGAASRNRCCFLRCRIAVMTTSPETHSRRLPKCSPLQDFPEELLQNWTYTETPPQHHTLGNH